MGRSTWWYCIRRYVCTKDASCMQISVQRSFIAGKYASAIATVTCEGTNQIEQMTCGIYRSYGLAGNARAHLILTEIAGAWGDDN